MIRTAARALLLIGMAISASAEAERQPVLGQIDLPHPYYYREMFLPQLTSGPSSLAWSPDSTELIYSMAGSLWRQNLDSGVASQLTAAAAYDYQPDWSPDGRWVIYCSYRDDAIELWALDLKSGAAHALTHNGAVNVEPRFSPDGRRIVFTSTLYNKRFHVFTADFTDGALTHIARLTGEHRSELPRYYYSPFDHEINPIWSRDGREIIYVSNRGRIYGTGGFWRIGAPAPGAAPLPDAEERGAGKPFHTEETNWKARPDLSPDGSRLVYSSYLGGRSWQTLWLMPAGGGDAFPVDLRRLGHDLSALVAGRNAHRLRLESGGQHRAWAGSGSRAASLSRSRSPSAGIFRRWPRSKSCSAMARGIPPPRASA